MIRYDKIRFLVRGQRTALWLTNALWGDYIDSRVTGGETCDQRGLTGHAQNPGEATMLCERSASRCLIQSGCFMCCSAPTFPLQLLDEAHPAEGDG